MEARGDRRPGGAIATGSVTAGGQRSVTAGGHAQDVGTNVGGTGLGERLYRLRGGRPADCRWLVGIEANSEAVSD